MKDKINFGIGFISGRPNVCTIINSYGQFIVEQLKELNTEVNLTVYILYDLNYQHSKKEDFYKIKPEIYEHIKIKHITPENILEYKKEIKTRYNMTESDVELFIGSGYGKARNAILYCAMKDQMNSILFWDDDEYPVANVMYKNNLIWIKQKNALQHVKNIDKAAVTYGYRCGMMNPVPYIQYTDELTEETYKNFIDALENEVVSWEKMRKFQIEKADRGVIAYADMKIAKGEQETEYVKDMGTNNFVLGSGICLNLDYIDNMPAFYNPPEARGEDTFFSCSLREKNAQVLRVPTYHFHDSFLQFRGIMKEKYPEELSKVVVKDAETEKRFLKATIGWTRYKPLLYYINDRKEYKDIIEKTRENLNKSVYKMNTAFKNIDFSCLIEELDKYDKNVEKHYQEYLKVNKIWDDLKYKIKAD